VRGELCFWKEFCCRDFRFQRCNSQ
jgi:hypothetical protein